MDYTQVSMTNPGHCAKPLQISQTPMKPYLLLAALSFAVFQSAFASYPLTVFDFNFRGTSPAEQIRGIDRMGFDGIAMPLRVPSDLAKLDAYQKAQPDLKLVAGLYLVDTSKPDQLETAHLQRVLSKLSEMDAKLWLIIGGEKGNPMIGKVLAEVADMAAAKGVTVSIYPHDNRAVETAEEALVYLKEARRPNLTISVHQCHEMRGGNTDRLDAVMAAVGPYMDLVTICGSDQIVHDGNPQWGDAIKPLGEGDYDPKYFLRALKRANFKGRMILHTYGLQAKPDSHFEQSLKIYQKMAAEVDAESIEVNREHR